MIISPKLGLIYSLVKVAAYCLLGGRGLPIVEK
jgi:hypothetical protein